MGDSGLLFPGRAGQLGAAAVTVALDAGIPGKPALLFGQVASFNSSPFWILRKNLAKFFGVSTRTITRYFRLLVDAQLIVNKPAPLGTIPPGCESPLPYRPWYKWPVGMPQLRQAVNSGSKEAFKRWQKKFEAQREQRVTRAKLGEILGTIVSRKSTTPSPKPAGSSAVSSTAPRRWTAEEIESELSRTSNAATQVPTDDTS